jgi:hypothetical protein
MLDVHPLQLPRKRCVPTMIVYQARTRRRRQYGRRTFGLKGKGRGVDSGCAVTPRHAEQSLELTKTLLRLRPPALNDWADISIFSHASD